MIDPLATVSRRQIPATPGARSLSGESVAASSGLAPATFGAVISDLAADALATVKAGEAAAIGGIKGQMSPRQVVEAVMAAEQALQATVAMRDKVVAAYLEISRMQI